MNVNFIYLLFILLVSKCYSQSAMTGTLTFLPDTMPEVMADPYVKIVSNTQFPGIDAQHPINWITRPDGWYEYSGQYQLGSFGLNFEARTAAHIAEYAANKTITFDLAYPGAKNEMILSANTSAAFKSYCANKMLVASRNQGTYSSKLQNSEDSGCAATLLAFCSPYAPDFCPLGRFYVNSRKSTTSSRQPKTPIALLDYFDGQPILNAFRNSNGSLRVKAVVYDVTGPNDDLDDGEKQFLLEFGRLNYIPANQQMGGTDQLNDYSESKIKFNGTIIQFGSRDNATHRHPCRTPLTTYINSAGYPVYQRIQGLFCKNGHVYRIGLSRDYMTGSIPNSFNKMKWMTAFDVYNNYMVGDIPDMTGMTALKSLLLFSNQFASVHSSLSTLTNLQILGLSFNLFSSNFLPDLTSLTMLKYFVCSRCKLTVFPFYATSVSFLDLSDNMIKMPLTNSIINSSFTSLTTLDLGFNSFYGNLPSNIFDNIPQLKEISFRQNNLTGVLPSFINTPIQNIQLGDNQFVDDIPWRYTTNPYIQIMNISNNLLVGPFDLRGFPLTDFNVAYNKINPYNSNAQIMFTNPQRKQYWNSTFFGKNLQSGCNYKGDSTCKLSHFDAWKSATGFTGQGFNNVFYVFPSSIVNINMAYNVLVGAYTSTLWTSTLNALLRLELQGNLITSIPGDIWGTITTKYNYLDFSNNILNLNIIYSSMDNYKITNDVSPISVITDGNPPSTMATVKFDNNPYFGVNYMTNATTKLPDWIVQSSSYINVGKFSCPILIGSTNPLLSMTIDPNYFGYSGCVCARGYFGIPPDCQNIPPLVQGENQQITDTDYGNQNNIRLMPGIDLTWMIFPSTSNVKSITVRIDKYPEFDITSPDYPDYLNKITISSNCPAGTSYNYQSKICSCPSGTLFNIKTNLCSTSDISNSVPQTTISLTSNDTSSKTIYYTIINEYVSINFQSKKLSGKHFSSNYSVSTVCPEGTLFYENQVNNFILSRRCEVLFKQSAGISYAVYAISALFSILLIAVTVIVVKKRTSLIIKSSSFPFCFVMLLFMTILSIGGIFYAISPEKLPEVCHLRAWITAFPLTVILSALLVKADRIRKIFASKELVVQAISNAQLAKVMSVMLLGETAILLWFSTGKISIAQLTIGSGSTANKLVHSCTDSSSAWIGVQFAYIALFLFAGVVEAWGVRKVPSAFNEGPHIASTLLSLTVLLVILIPVQFMVGDNPDALVVIRGIGQVLVSTVMAFFLFGPKLYYILEGKENDKSLTSMGSSKSSGSSSSFSSTSSSSTGNSQVGIDGTQVSFLIKKIVSAIEDMKAGGKDFSGIEAAFETIKKSSTNSEINNINSEINKLKEIIKK